MPLIPWAAAQVTKESSSLTDQGGYTHEATRPEIPDVEVRSEAQFLTGKPLLLQHLSRKDGLQWNEVSAILQDRQGFLWFGTPNGLQRYDGYTFTSFAPDPAVLDSDVFLSIHSLCEDREGLLWVGSYYGLYRLDPLTGTWTFFTNDPDDPDDLSVSIVSVVYEDRAGTLWVGTGFRQQQVQSTARGLNRLDRASNTFTHFRFDPSDSTSLSHDYVTAIHEDKAGAFWIGTFEGLNLMERSTGTMRRYLEGQWIRALFTDRSGTLWVGTATGLYHFDRQSEAFLLFAKTVGKPVGHRITEVIDIAEDQGGFLWIGTVEGLFRLDRATGRMELYVPTLGDPHSLTAAYVQDLYVDRSGILWIATGEPGLSSGALEKMDPILQTFDVYQHERYDALGLENKTVRALMEDRNGQIWIGTYSDPVIHFDPRTGEVTRTSFLGATAFLEDRAGHVWVGMYERPEAIEGGLGRYDPETGQSRIYRHNPSNPTSFGNNRVLEIYEDRTGTVWIGTGSWTLNGVKLSGFNRFNPETETFTRYYHDPNDSTSIGSDRVNTLYEDRSGTFWVGTWNGGLNRFDPSTETFTSYMHRPGDATSLSDNRVFGILEDRRGRFWVSTYRSLHLFVPEAEENRDSARIFFRQFNTVNSDLPSNWVMEMSEDQAGYLWLMTPSGIVRFDPETYAVETFDTFNRIVDISYIWGAHDQGRNGSLYFGGQEGFVVVNPSELQPNTVPPEVQLTALRIFSRLERPRPVAAPRRPLSVLDTLTLAYGENDFEIDYVGLHYRNPERNRYAYRLEGYDSAWREVGSQRTARYAGLAPGSYTFRVKASNSDGVWNEEGASIILIITAPWWRTGWAYALYVVALLSLVYGGYIWRFWRLERHARELRRLVDARTRELTAEQKKTEAQALELLELDEAKSRFFANISHEFRTPLTLILGPLSDILGGAHGPINEAMRRQLKLMRRSSRRLHGLISQLLDLSKLDVGRMALQAHTSDLIPFLKTVVLSFSPMAERQHLTLQFNAGVETLSCSFDADKLEKIVVNLLSNAFKFTPKGGKIRVGVNEAFSGQDSFVEIQVIDSGRGIPETELPYVFDRFYQVSAKTTREHEGTGIGLALAKELVSLHGGTIRVESEEGFGSSFTVRLPMTQKPSEFPDAIEERRDDLEGADRADVVPGTGLTDEHRFGDDGKEREVDLEEPIEAPRGSPTILIVDDNTDVREYLNTYLRGYYHIIEANDGLEGLGKARAQRPDLVITDVMMPNMDGVALCRAIKEDEHLNHIPVILLTAKADEEAEVEGLSAGADDYVIKPFRAEALLARAENLIEIRRLLRQRFSGQVVVLPTEVVVPSDEAAFLERVRELVEAHLGDHSFTVEWLADEVGLSPRQLQRRLRTLTTLSPAGLIRMMRLERAAQLLDQNAGTISEIAYRVGFKDPHYFSRLFQQTFGSAPTQHLTHRS